jgi:2-keto-4-pentenoate hydratase
MRRLALFMLAAGLTAAAPGQLEFTLQPAEVAEHQLLRWPINRAIPVQDLDAAYRYQDAVVAALTNAWGARAGYKAALTSEAMRQRFRADRPVLGVVMQSMLLRDRAFLDDGFAARPVIEADLMALVRDESINDAVTPEELLAALEGIHPLIEVADLLFVEGASVDPLWLTAVNAGARYAVVGDPLVLDGTDTNVLDRLPGVRASIMDKQGQVIASGEASAIMGHPIESVRWIRDEVKARGGTLAAGDVLWLGSMTVPVPVVAGESYQVLYTGLREYPVSIQVNIRRSSNAAQP